MKRGQQKANEDHQKRPKLSPASDQSGKDSPRAKFPGQATADSSDTTQRSPRAGPTIVINDGDEESFGSIETKSEPMETQRASEKVQVSSLSSPESHKPLGASPRPQSTAEQSFIPRTITCNLRVTFETTQCKDEFPVLLHEPGSYQEIEEVAERHAKNLSAESIGSKELKFSYGNCTIVSDTRKTRHPLRSPEDWSKVNRAVVGYWNSQTREHIRLSISRHYLVSQEKPVQGKSFAKDKKLEIHDRMQENWERRAYIPHNVLEMLISDETISWIIKEHPPKGMLREQQDLFIRRVQSEGRILLAMCVHESLEMECLKILLDKGLKDSTLPLDEKDQCHRECRREFKTLVQAQGGYQAERFVEGEHKTLHSHAVVPLHFCSRAHAKDDIDREVTEGCGDKLQISPRKEIATKEDAWCGAGAHSNVYCVKLNPNHHSLSVDLDACFALKEFTDRPKLAKNFDRELAMLKELRRFSHLHIVTHLATWTQDERYYMLFPFAQCNMREYMARYRFAKTDDFWLLAQFHGMAGAVKRIHDLSEVDSTTATLNVKTSAAVERRTGWHHDIKPENILFFKDDSSKPGMFRISDWGSAKVNTYRTRSYHTRHPIGTLTYEPPELTYEGETSRPYDLWSLGCVFLELLIWAVFGPTNLENFSDQREDVPNANSGTGSMKDDAFWQKKGEKYVLRDIVITKLQHLDKALTEPGKPPFKEVVGYIRRMLEPELHKRIKALELYDLLDRTSLTKAMEVENPRDESEPSAHMTLIPTNPQSPEQIIHGNSSSSRSSGPGYAENYELSPLDMSPRANRHSRNSSASELTRSNATHSRQSSDTSMRSTLSVRERRGSHSSTNSPRVAERGV